MWQSVLCFISARLQASALQTRHRSLSQFLSHQCGRGGWLPVGWASKVNTASYAPVHPSQTRARWRLSSSPHPVGHLRQWSAVFFALSRRNCTRSLNVCSLLLIACPRSRLPLEFHLVTRVNLSTNSTVPRKSKLRCPLLLKILECS